MIELILAPLAALSSYLIFMGLFHGLKGLNAWQYLNAVTRTIHNPESTLKPEVFSRLKKDFNGNNN